MFFFQNIERFLPLSFSTETLLSSLLQSNVIATRPLRGEFRVESISHDAFPSEL